MDRALAESSFQTASGTQSEPRTVVNARIAPALRKQLEALAAGQGLSLSELIHRVLNDHVRRQEAVAVARDLRAVGDQVACLAARLDRLEAANATLTSRVEQLLAALIGVPR